MRRIFLHQKFKKPIFRQLWLVVIVLFISIACSFPGMVAYSGKADELSKLPAIPTKGEYYGDLNPSDPGGWIYEGNCRTSKGFRLWLEQNKFIYTLASVCGSTKDSGIETWKTHSSGTDADPFGQIFPKGMIYTSFRILTWQVGQGVGENKDIKIKGLIGKISIDMSKIEYCFVDDQGIAYDEATLLYTYQEICEDHPSSIILTKVN